MAWILDAPVHVSDKIQSLENSGRVTSTIICFERRFFSRNMYESNESSQHAAMSAYYFRIGKAHLRSKFQSLFVIDIVNFLRMNYLTT